MILWENCFTSEKSVGCHSELPPLSFWEAASWQSLLIEMFPRSAPSANTTKVSSLSFSAHCATSVTTISSRTLPCAQDSMRTMQTLQKIQALPTDLYCLGKHGTLAQGSNIIQCSALVLQSFPSVLDLRAVTYEKWQRVAKTPASWSSYCDIVD